MLYKNQDIDKLPNIVQVRDFLRNLILRYPVLHRKPYELEIPNQRKFVMTPLVGGGYSLKPNITKQGLLFRGDYEVHDPFLPKSYQKDANDDIFERIKRETYLITAESYPLFRLLKDGINIGNDRIFSVYNPDGMAACYDCTTPYVQLTSDLDTAIMYAITRNGTNGKRKYLDYNDAKVGVVYVFELFNVFGQISGLSTLGLQAFERPGRMREFLFRMASNMNFNNLKNVKGFTFRHNEAVERRLLNEIQRPKVCDVFSEKINKNFEKCDGKLKLPKDVLYRIRYKNSGNQVVEDYENKLNEKIEFVERPLTDIQFQEDLSEVNLIEKWLRICDQIVPIIKSDSVIIDKLKSITDKAEYSKYFKVEQWLDSLKTNEDE